MRTTLAVAVSVSALTLAGCTSSDHVNGATSSSPSPTRAKASNAVDYSDLDIDDTAWQYDEANDVYYQTGVTYVLTPAAAEYETLGIYVPGAYMTAEPNGDGTYTAATDERGKVGDFTAASAPIVFPVNTPGYAAQAAPTDYDYETISAYMEAGFIYVWPGLRGRDSNTDTYTGNSPWGVTDLKAAIRYIRYNSEALAGDAEEIYVFGHSGGGAQSAVAGASGDSELYTPYLSQIGAAMNDADGYEISDAVDGVMAWCPITSLDTADAAYEWNMGQFASDGTRADGTWTKAFSNDLAEDFARYINEVKLKDSGGRALTLEESDSGIYLAGSYYDYLLETYTKSLNEFLATTQFPYTPSNQEMAGMDGAGAPAAGAPADGGPEGQAPSGQMPSGGAPDGDGGDSAPGDGAAPDGGSAQDDSSSESTTYETAQDYIDALNADGEWVAYDASTNTATVTSLAGFVGSQKNASKDVGAFDAPDRSATENVVMGSGEDGLHFDEQSAKLLKANAERYASASGWSDEYAASAYESDFAFTDPTGTDVATRVDMYNPMYYLSEYYDGAGTSTVAGKWRIRTGAQQGDTASTVEINLALALENAGVGDVDFATVWGQGHTMAETSGDATSNFIAWVTKSASK